MYSSMTKNNLLSLSKLSRGRGYDRGPYIEILYDDEDVNSTHYTEFLQSRLDTNQSSREHHTPQQLKALSLPKTFSTKRGQLLLFSEDYIEKIESKCVDDSHLHSHRSNVSSKALSTTVDLRNSILTFGLSKENAFELANNKRENTLAYLQAVKRKSQTRNIRPGYSAKRYLANWSKHWRPDLIDNLFKQGKLCQENLFEQSSVLPNVKHRIDDDISRVPPAYRIQRQWLTLNIGPLKGYRFYRTRSNMFESADENGFKDSEAIDEHQLSTENIRVLDREGDEIEYSKLNKNDQELLLTELLFQTALYHINTKHVNSYNSFSTYVDHLADLNHHKNDKNKKISVKRFDGRILTDNLPNNDQDSYMFRSVPGHKLSLKSEHGKPKRSCDAKDFEYCSRSVSPAEYYSVFNKSSRESNTNQVKKKSSENVDSSAGAFVVAPDGSIIKLGQKLSLSNAKINSITKPKQSLPKAEDKILLESVPATHPTLTPADLVTKYSTSNEELTSEFSGLQLSKELLLAIANHAQQIAKYALNKYGSGVSLVEDVKLAINENYKKFKMAFKSGEITSNEFDEYNLLIKNTLKNSLTDLFSQSNSLSDISIDNELLEKLLDFPPDAFELVINKENDSKIIRLKSSYSGSNKNDQPHMSVDNNLNLTENEQNYSQHTLVIEQKNDTFEYSESNISSTQQIEEQQFHKSDETTGKNESNEAESVKKESKPIKIEITPKQSQIKIGEIKKDETLKIKPVIESAPAATIITEKIVPPKIKKSKDSTRKNQSDTVKSNKKKASFKIGKPKDQPQPPSLGLKESVNPLKKKNKQIKNKTEEIKESTEVEKAQQSDETLVNMYGNNKEEAHEAIADDSNQDFNITLISRPDQMQEKYEDVKFDKTLERHVRINLPNLPPEQEVAKADEPEIDLNDALLKGLNAAEIREYKRKLAAEQRKKDLLKKRLEKEEAARRDEEEALRRFELATQMEEDRLRRAEEARLARLADLERKRLADLEEDQALARQLEQQELERRLRDEKQRHMDLLKFKMMEEMARKAKLDQERREEEERKRREEEEMLLRLSEEEREKYLALKKIEDEERRVREELERKQREEELERTLKEAKERALEEARLKAELERHLRFIRSIHDESKNLTQSQSITRAFVFSYFDLLQYLGIEMPSELLPKTKVSKTNNDIIKKYSMNNTK